MHGAFARVNSLNEAISLRETTSLKLSYDEAELAIDIKCSVIM